MLKFSLKCQLSCSCRDKKNIMFELHRFVVWRHIYCDTVYTVSDTVYVRHSVHCVR